MERDKHVSRNTSVAVNTWAIWFKRLRLVMGSLLHATDQLREMLSTDQSMRDRRSRGRWSVLSISRVLYTLFELELSVISSCNS